MSPPLEERIWKNEDLLSSPSEDDVEALVSYLCDLQFIQICYDASRMGDVVHQLEQLRCFVENRSSHVKRVADYLGFLTFEPCKLRESRNVTMAAMSEPPDSAVRIDAERIFCFAFPVPEAELQFLLKAEDGTLPFQATGKSTPKPLLGSGCAAGTPDWWPPITWSHRLPIPPSYGDRSHRVHPLRCVKNTVCTGLYSFHNSYRAISYGNTVFEIERKDGTHVRTVETRPRPHGLPSVCTDGSLLCVRFGDNTSEVWSILTGQVVAVISRQIRALSERAWVGVYTKRQAKEFSLVSLASGCALGWSGESDDGAFAFTPSGESLLASAHRGRVVVWGVARGESLRIVCHPIPSGVHVVTVSYDGALAVSVNGNSALVWEVDTGRVIGNLSRFLGPLGRLTGEAEIGPGCEVLVPSDKSVLLAWNFRDMSVRDLIDCDYRKTRSGDVLRVTAYDPGTGRLLCWRGGVVHEWTLPIPRGAERGLHKAHGRKSIETSLTKKFMGSKLKIHGLRGVRWSPDGLVIVYYTDHDIYMVSAVTGLAMHCLVHHPHDITAVAFSPNGCLLAYTDLADPRMLCVMDVSTRQPVCRVSANIGAREGTLIQFSLDGRYLTLADPMRTMIFDLVSQEAQVRALPSSERMPLAVPPRQTFQLLCAEGKDVVVYDIAEGIELSRRSVWRTPLTRDRHAEFCSTGSRVLLRDAGMLSVWAWDGVSLAGRLFVYSYPPGIPCISGLGTDGSLVAFVQGSARVEVWAVHPNRCAHVLGERDLGCTGLLWFQSRLLVVCSHSLLLWHVPRTAAP